MTASLSLRQKWPPEKIAAVDRQLRLALRKLAREGHSHARTTIIASRAALTVAETTNGLWRRQKLGLTTRDRGQGWRIAAPKASDRAVIAKRFGRGVVAMKAAMMPDKARARDRLRQFLADMEAAGLLEFSYPEMMETTGLTRRWASYALKRLIGLGRLRVWRGVYRIAA